MLDFLSNLFKSNKHIILQEAFQITDIAHKLPINKNRILSGETIPTRLISQINKIVIHCSDFKDRLDIEDVYKVAQYDVTPSPTNHLSPNGAFTISYHYFIEYLLNELKIYKCLDDKTIGWHAKGWNTQGLAIAVNKLGADPAPDLFYAACWTAAQKCKELNLGIESIVFHRNLEGTGYIIENGEKKQLKTCPGNWNEDEFKKDTLAILKGIS